MPELEDQKGKSLSKKYFGTDGIRGRVGESPITAEFALKLGWAVGKVLATTGSRTVVIGKDTRLSGYMIESALEAGLSASGANISLLGPMPTPAVSWLTRSLRANAGIVISASHNPYYDNGFKFFGADGEKLPDQTELAIEAALDETLETVPSGELGKASRVEDAAGRYIEHCKTTLKSASRFEGMHVVLDCAHGANYLIAPKAFRELGAKVTAIGNQPDGLNINNGCGSTHLEALQEAVTGQSADLGIAFDGDGDRVLVVDSQGNVVNGDQLIFVMANRMHRDGVLGGGVVGTLMSNYGMQVALKERGIDFERAKVGDRYVLARLKDRGWRLGGEASGHIIDLQKAGTGDGLINALSIVEMLLEESRPLHELVAEMPMYPQVMINVPVAKRVDISGNQAISAAVQAAEERLENKGRVVLRPSGTEPLIRVTVEGQDKSLVEELSQQLADVVAGEYAS